MIPNKYTEKVNIYFVFKLLSIIIISEAIVGLLFYQFDIDLTSASSNWPIPLKLFAIIIFAPLFETLIFQYLIYKWLNQLIRNPNFRYNNEAYIIASSIAFSLQHYQSVWYMAYTLIPGVVLAYCFLHFHKLYGDFSTPFWFTAAVHALLNSFVFIIDLFLNYL